MNTPTTESRVSDLEQDRDAVLKILQIHSEALQRLDSKVDRLDSKVDRLADDVGVVKDDVGWIKKKLS